MGWIIVNKKMLTKAKLKSEFAKDWKKQYENPFFLSQKESVASQRKILKM